MAVRLTPREQALLDGKSGSGAAMAMRLVQRLADAMGADELLPIEGAHIDSCLYHGQSGLDFVNALVEGGASVSVPTTLNVSSLDLLHPELVSLDEPNTQAARALMDAYVALGCEPTWTCAPYQRPERPALGQHVAWAESNAIVFANSVLGARTHRYGDFIDIAAAVTGVVPRAGLHTTPGRTATHLFSVQSIPRGLLAEDLVCACLGHVIGDRCHSGVPAVVGLLPTTTEDQLKALGAAAASSGNIAMFHAIGLTPEAPSLDAACNGQIPAAFEVTVDMLRDAYRELCVNTESVADGTAVATVSLGTPHYSLSEIERLVHLLAGHHVDPSVAFYVSTSREILHEAQLRGWVRALEASGVQFVTDTCTYITPVIRNATGLAMTDSAKWAYYAPGNIGVNAIFATTADCVASALQGQVVRNFVWPT